MSSILSRNSETGRFERRYHCNSCRLIRVNGHVVHEIGCPDAWMDETRECRLCGDDFTPEYRQQRCCPECQLD